MTIEAAADELVAKLKRLHVLGTVDSLLGWDEQVNLPPGSAELRAQQLALMAEVRHAAATDSRLGELIATLEEKETARPALRSDSGQAVTPCALTPDLRVILRHARRDYDRATKLPADFMREKAEHGSRAYHAWAACKPKSDFAGFAPFLEKHLELARREAAYLGKSEAPYDYFIDQHDPGLTEAVIAGLFDELKAGLAPLAREIAASPVKAKAEILRGFPVDRQRDFLREVTGRLGFDYNRGRIDVALHPFCSGSGADTRMTTRFDAGNPLGSLFSAVHETGHGLYEQGLPVVDHGTALGEAVGMAVHESQSRIWENQVARGRAFWRFFEPRYRELFAEQLRDVSSGELYLAINAVRPSLIRTESDEVTYNLHIILRFEIEKRLFAGTLAVGDLPAAWSEGMKELLGLKPSNHREGVLQDVHWSGGSFGYFPSYCLGNMIAAQLWYKALGGIPDLEEDFTRGDFSRLLGWLRQNIHERGRRLDTLDLVRAVTGAPLSPRPLLRYLRERYLPLYL